MLLKDPHFDWQQHQHSFRVDPDIVHLSGMQRILKL